jgi:23S rRNA pseudouridine2604 synthase
MMRGTQAFFIVVIYGVLMNKRLSLLRTAAKSFLVGCLLLNGVVAVSHHSHSVAFLSPTLWNGGLSKSGSTKNNSNGRTTLDHSCNDVWNPKRSCLYSSAHDSDSDHDDKGIRLNKVFKATHSRREADALIDSGRVSVNGQTVSQKGGFLVQPFVDKVALDGKLIEGWEAMNGFQSKSTSINNPALKPNMTDDRRTTIQTQDFEYIKYWKPRGITCTTDPSIESNIIDDLTTRRGFQPKHRVYPVGRLDKDSSGLILLTSDGRLPNSALRGMFKQPKVYHVLVDLPLREFDIERLRKGVVITTTAQREGKNRGKALTAPTLPCQVERIPGSQQRGVTMTLFEGRNRQIRRMMQALGNEVIELHRVQFMGITLEPLERQGEWKVLDEGEMALVQHVLHLAATVTDPQ